MRVIATERAAEVVEKARTARHGRLTVTIGTGCCESTAPFLYEDFWLDPEQEQVGTVAGVGVYAPRYVRDLYPDDDGVTLDVVEEIAESLSIETEWGYRLILRGKDQTTLSGQESQTCDVPAASSEAIRTVVGEMPEHLRNLRIRS
ncbi:MAG: DUF779 domain-containing protein [Acidimicrobiales bacterium]